MCVSERSGADSSFPLLRRLAAFSSLRRLASHVRSVWMLCLCAHLTDNRLSWVGEDDVRAVHRLHSTSLHAGGGGNNS